MSDCPWSVQVAESLDEAELRPDLSAHLAECSDCRELLAELRADAALLASAPGLPNGAEEMLQRSVHQQLARSRRRTWIAALVAVAAALTLVVLNVGEPKPQPRPEVAVAGDVDRPLAPPPVGATEPSAPVEHTAQTTGPRKHHLARRPAEVQKLHVVAMGDHIVVEKQTADPNVVILLVGDGE